ncbi:tetratricopeptide repeat protein [Bacillus cereus]|uniref:tetratricopeptide repeat protein n=1 Tax=Bacillus cereus group TaxID=86661 RepID=UPI000CD7E4B6|nr:MULTISPECIES: tetratricopeptide repeat protein [Bacillus cereus group]MEC3196189.1 tetratricopeptide repeat protein [Bacillus cereus]QFQ28450.1 tetratricopeptide repeat protein [Bacillus thuringiensis]WJX08148.1 tetratricopeptide repeat protein [Bacillus cereus]
MLNILDQNIFSRTRTLYIDEIKKAWNNTYIENNNLFLALIGEPGSGKLDTIEHFVSGLEEEQKIILSNGQKLCNGYLAGFYELFLYMFYQSEEKYPQILSKHEQTLKRLFPFLNSGAYKVPKDLTNTASQDERTRFYHHEFQEKLLHGLYEFFLDFCLTTKEKFILVIDNAEDLPPTTKSFLEIMTYRKELHTYINIILLYDQKIDFNLKKYCTEINFSPLDKTELIEIINKREITVDEKTIDSILSISEGNISKALVLLECIKHSISVFEYLTFETYADFYLNIKGESYRHMLLKRYIDNHCIDDNPIILRNYQVTSKQFRDQLHRQKIKQIEEGNVENKLMHLVHYISLSSEVEQLMLLSPIAIKLQEIGVYNTWFDIFSKYFINKDLRILPDGDELHNAVFVRMSFILYSLGIAKLSIPYLELFYDNFPDSKLIPMILYSQSMTYGRYQVPVNLEKAEEYGLLNLEKIDSMFKDHPKYVYIKVFAENALAYIRAKQGRFDEAIELCTKGLKKMKDIYGDSKYALHQSILIYNTGQVYELIGDFDNAYKMYQNAIRLDPYYGEYYNDLANLLQNHERLDEALTFYQKAIDLCPPYYEAHINRAGVYEKLGKIKEAKVDYERAIELKPDASFAYDSLAVIYYQEENYSLALQLINKAIYFNSKEGQFYSNRGLILQELGMIDEAQDNFNKAILLKPKLSEAYSNAAVLAYSKGEYESSLNYINQAITLNDDSDYLINRGILYNKINRMQEALQDFELAQNKKGHDDYLAQLIKETKTNLYV